MLKKMQRRFIGAAMAAFTAVILVLFCVVNAGNYRSVASQQDDTLVRLIAMPNVIVSSHQAFLTKEALNNIAAVTVDNLLKFGRGEPSPDTEVCAPKEQDQRRS